MLTNKGTTIHRAHLYKYCDFRLPSDCLRDYRNYLDFQQNSWMAFYCSAINAVLHKYVLMAQFNTAPCISSNFALLGASFLWFLHFAISLQQCWLCEYIISLFCIFVCSVVVGSVVTILFIFRLTGLQSQNASNRNCKYDLCMCGNNLWVHYGDMINCICVWLFFIVCLLICGALQEPAAIINGRWGYTYVHTYIYICMYALVYERVWMHSNENIHHCEGMFVNGNMYSSFALLKAILK